MCTMRGGVSNPQHAKFDDALCIAVFGTQNSFDNNHANRSKTKGCSGSSAVSFVIGVL